MTELLALNWLNFETSVEKSELALLSPKQLVANMFTVRCIAENIESVVSEEYRSVADMLVEATGELYELIHIMTDDSNGEIAVSTAVVVETFTKLENILNIFDDCVEDMNRTDLRFGGLWLSLDLHLRNVRCMFIDNPNFIF